MKLKFLICFFALAMYVTSCSKDDDSNSTNTTETEELISVFSDVEFSLDDSARFYATSTGRMYGASAIDSETSKIIDLVGDSNQAFIAFSSPSAVNEIANGTVTKIQHTNVSMTVAEFDAIKDSKALAAIKVTNDNDSVGLSDYKNNIILFENADGKKGAIKLKAINATRLLVDIKVVK
ncbi:hypothetical protein ABW636_19915 [Aquimarina sp. 2201CG1-2-11]|uniref:hypothetical protein n=1 Tax=Aquimarina discodermiae TaxID=3231043 RepID=UPI0034625F2C